MYGIKGKLFLVLLLVCSASVQADTDADSSGLVVEDGSITLTYDELEYIYKNAPPAVRSQAGADASARYELIANTVASKRMYEGLVDLSPEDGDEYFRFQFALLAAAREYEEKRFQIELEIPDLEALTRERYRVSKKEFALVPELRLVSHILLLCSESCDAESKKQELEKLLTKIIAGESFADLAIAHSQDPGSKARGGRLSNPISREDERVDSEFRGAVFGLEKTGDLSDIVRSRFGFHIIRLEGVEPARERTYEELEEPLRAEVEKRYREDAYRNYLLSMGPTDAMFIDYHKVDAIMGPLAE